LYITRLINGGKKSLLFSTFSTVEIILRLRFLKVCFAAIPKAAYSQIQAISDQKLPEIIAFEAQV
jgi:hypothetical protein